MVVVSDTSPIINLAAIGYLQLLPDLFTEIVVPTAVYNEVVIQGVGEPGAQELNHATWVKVIDVNNPLLISELLQDLDLGEAEAIALALDLGANYILMDEAAGRSIALSYNVQPIGVLGILLKAKRHDYIGNRFNGLLTIRGQFLC
jgi:predicted nucleic acid-binding protein